VVHEAIRQQAIPVVVIEQDAGAVAALREQGVPVLQGSASNPVILERAGIERARVLIAAIPDPLSIRRIVEVARERNPEIDIVVRTHSQSERRHIEAQGADQAVVGELELAMEMSRHTLRRFGVADAPAELLLRKVRAQSQDG
jgi:CPA2 family monovalent cation:H+ antiporter-2